MDSYKKMLRSGSHPTSLKEGCAEMTPPAGTPGTLVPIKAHVYFMVGRHGS